MALKRDRGRDSLFNHAAAVSEHCEHLVSSLTLISQAQKQARQNNTNTKFEVTDYIPCVIDEAANGDQ